MKNEFGEGSLPTKPVDQVLRAATIRAIRRAQSVNSFVLKKMQDFPFGRPISAYTKLTEASPLSPAQVETLKNVVFNPKSYWHGSPMYRRFPSIPGFAFEIRGGDSDIDLLVDLHNPGWEFFGEGEDYSAFNFAGSILTQLAKELFPHLASSYKESVWRKGAIKALEHALDEGN